MIKILGSLLCYSGVLCNPASAQTGSAWNPPPKDTFDTEGRVIWRKGLDDAPSPPPAVTAAEPALPPPATAPSPQPTVQIAPEPPAAPAPKVTISEKYIALDLGKIAVFEFNSAKLDANSLKRINALATVLMKVATRWQSIEVAGHSDTVGNEAANLDISSRRAQAVKDAIIRAGIPAGRVASKGYGATQLLTGVDGTSESQRRVEVRFIGVKESDRNALADDLTKAISEDK